MAEINNKNADTLRKIYEQPTRSDIRWAKIEAFFRALGATIIQRKGSKVCVKLNQERAVFHTPHPEKEACKGLIEDIRELLYNADIQP